jgi:hypothetical protein
MRLLAFLYVPVRENDYFQYDYVLRENDYFQYDYVLHENNYISVNDYFPKAVRGTSLQRLATASTQYDYTEQGPSTTSMSSPRDNGAPVDSVNRPAFGYTLNLFCVFLFESYLRFNLNTSTCFAFTGSLIFVMNMLIISGIKMYRKLPSFLTLLGLAAVAQAPGEALPGGDGVARVLLRDRHTPSSAASSAPRAVVGAGLASGFGGATGTRRRCALPRPLPVAGPR